MRARLNTVLRKLASLPGLRLVPWGNSKWQTSSAVSGVFWVLNTYVIFSLVEQFGHGVRTSILASLGWDVLTYAIKKLLIWRRSGVSLKFSYSRNFALWLAFFGANALLAWLLISQVDISVHHTRYILGALGILVNPLRFKIDNEFVFEKLKTEPA